MRGDSRGAHPAGGWARGARGSPLVSAPEPGDTRAGGGGHGLWGWQEGGGGGGGGGNGSARRRRQLCPRPPGPAGDRVWQVARARCLGMWVTEAGGRGHPLGTRRADLPPGSEKKWLPSVLKASPGSGSFFLRFPRTHFIGLNLLGS